MNNIVLIGNLTKDSELKFASGTGKAITTFTIGVQRNFKNSEGKYESDFFNVVVYGARAESVANYTQKGSKVAVMGSLRNRSYEAKDGTKRYVTEIVANEVTFLDSKKGAGKKENKPPVDMFGATPDDSDSDIPF